MLIHREGRIERRIDQRTSLGDYRVPTMDDGTTAERSVHPDLESRIATPKVSPGPPSMVLRVLRSRY